MNAIMFGCKRAYYGCLHVTRRPLRVIGLTAARFDMMYALLREKNYYRPRTQRELRDLLGVSSPVISRMLRSLEQLGWVVRKRPEYGDGRTWEVSLTDDGRTTIQDAHRALRRAAMRLMSEALSFGRPRNAFWNMCMFESYQQAVRREFFDRGRLSYPWHPDD